MIYNLLEPNFNFISDSTFGVALFILMDVILALVIVIVSYRWVFKYVFDFLFGLLASVITLPVWLSVIIVSKIHMIQTNEYTSLFAKRFFVGKNGKPIVSYSFTVVSDLEGELTKLGGFLRKTGIERLPVVFDLLLLKRSIIGVKPLSLVDEKFVSAEDYVRFSVRPGFINPLEAADEKKGGVTYEDMFESDKRYAQKYGFFTDLKIIISFFVNKIRGEKSDVFYETEQKSYAQTLLARGEITESDYTQAYAEAQTILFPKDEEYEEEDEEEDEEEKE